MATIPFAADGYGNNSTAAYVFGMNVKQDLSSLVEYRCYDNNSTFPQIEATPLTDVANEVIAGTAGTGSLSMIGLIDTSSGTQATSAWFPTAETGGASEIKNLMNGNTSYVVQEGGSGTIATADSAGNYNTDPQIRWNMAIEVPSDATTAMDMRFEIQITYTYTGSDPVPQFYGNDGSQGTRDWGLMTVQSTSGGHGLLHTRASAVVGSLFANIPSSATELTGAGWVTLAPA